MAVTVSDFQLAYPAWAKANPAMLAARLAQVELQVSPDSWGAKRDLVVMLVLADVLTCDPSGRDAQLAGSEQSGPTTYRRQIWDLQRSLRFANPTLFGTIDLTEADL